MVLTNQCRIGSICPNNYFVVFYLVHLGRHSAGEHVLLRHDTSTGQIRVDRGHVGKGRKLPVRVTVREKGERQRSQPLLYLQPSLMWVGRYRSDHRLIRLTLCVGAWKRHEDLLVGVFLDPKHKGFDAIRALVKY